MGERRLENLTPLGEIPVDLPEPPHGDGEPQRGGPVV
jgi:hypothetical protein